MLKTQSIHVTVKNLFVSDVSLSLMIARLLGEGGVVCNGDVRINLQICHSGNTITQNRYLSIETYTVEPLNCGQIWNQSNMVTIESFLHHQHMILK